MLIGHHGFDHVYTQVPDLDAALKVLHQLGFATTSKDFSAPENLDVTSLVFQQSWLAFGAQREAELSANMRHIYETAGLAAACAQASEADAAILRQCGPMPTLILSMSDTDSFVKSLTDIGLEGMGPRAFPRVTQTPDGPRDLAFEMAMGNINLMEDVAPGFGAGGLSLFGLSVGDETSFRRPDTLAHPNTVRDVDYVVFGCQSPGRLYGKLQSAFGERVGELPGGSGLEIDAPPARIHVLTPAKARELYALEGLDPAPDAVQVAAIGLSVTQLEHVTFRCDDTGIVPQHLSSGALRLTLPELAYLNLDFVPAR